MAIPDYQTIMLPLLQLAGDEREHRFRDTVEQLATQFELSDAERGELLPSGTAPVFDNRVGWARTYLKQAGLLQSPRRGIFQITATGKLLLAEKPERINVSLLERYSEFQAFRTRKRDRNEVEVQEAESAPIEDQTPEDALAAAYQKLRKNLEADLLEQIKNASPTFFERLVIDLLVSMGYGGSRRDAGRAIGKSGDGGIDGIIKEDKLGLDVIYVQAKRWEGVVGRPEFRNSQAPFRGSAQTKEYSLPHPVLPVRRLTTPT